MLVVCSVMLVVYTVRLVPHSVMLVVHTVMLVVAALARSIKVTPHLWQQIVHLRCEGWHYKCIKNCAAITDRVFHFQCSFTSRHMRNVRNLLLEGGSQQVSTDTWDIKRVHVYLISGSIIANYRSQNYICRVRPTVFDTVGTWTALMKGARNLQWSLSDAQDANYISLSLCI